MRKPSLLIQHDETANIGGVDGKKVFVIDDAANQVTKFRPDVDDATQAALVVEYAHHEVHEGDHYYVKGWIDIPASTSTDFLFVTPNTAKWIHAKWEIASEAEATFVLYEDTTTAALGSAVTIYNNNRNSANTPGVLAFSTPSVSATGTAIYSGKLGSGRAIGGSAGREHEMIAKQNTKYLFRITNNDGTATRWTGYDFYWYEHQNLT